ncbi:MAG: DUF2232 domain-containing protein [Pseudomonadota bacterium]
MTNQTPTPPPASSGPNIWVIGALAGAATLLLFLAANFGGGSGFLGLFVPLPSLIAGLAYGWPVAGLAGLVGAVLVFFLSQGSGLAGLLYAVVVAVPVTLLTQLSGYWRSDDGRMIDAFRQHPSEVPGVNAGDPALWMPLSTILTAIVFLASALATMMTLSLGSDELVYKSNVHELVDHFIETRLGPNLQTPLQPEQIANLKESAAALLPATAAIGWMLLMVFNLWLAGRIAAASGMLMRPVPPLRTVALPRIILFGLGVALILASIGGIPGRLATAFAGAAVFTLILIGLAVLHEWSLGRPARPLLLGGVYVGVFFASILTVPPLVLLALGDWFFDLRGRARARGSSPPPPPSS